jgi:D-alanyl-D-alanine carboxypeptidase
VTDRPAAARNKSALHVLAFAAGVVLLLSMLGTGAAEAKSTRTGLALQGALNKVIRAPQGPPGISGLIVRSGKRQFFRRGKGNLRSGSAPKLWLPFRIASVSKAYSGAVALSLVAQGKLELDDSIGELLPGLLPRARKVTLAQLLHHTSGLADYIKDEGFVKKLIARPGRYMTPKRLLSFVRTDRLAFRPGSKYEYSDSDNIVVGLMAQKVTGIPFEWLLRREIAPRSFFGPTRLPRRLFLPSPFLHGYDVQPGKQPEDVSRLINPALAWASGGMISSLPALSRFMRAYVGGRIFGAPERRAQRKWIRGSSSPPGPGVNSAGLALFRYRTRCGTVFGHTGSFPGYRIFAASSADGRTSIAYVANAQIVPGQGSPRVSALIRRSQVAAVCHALR